MRTYSVLLALDVPHYGCLDIEAATDAEAIAKAMALDPGEVCTDPDWYWPTCRRIVHVEDPGGALIAQDVALDDYFLRHVSQLAPALCDEAPALLAVLERIAAIPLWGESIADPELRAAYVDAREYDGDDGFTPSCDTESEYMREAVETARNAIACYRERLALKSPTSCT